jgi:hypothetical protein
MYICFSVSKAGLPGGQFQAEAPTHALARIGCLSVDNRRHHRQVLPKRCGRSTPRHGGQIISSPILTQLTTIDFLQPFFEQIQQIEASLFSSRAPAFVSQRNVLQLGLTGTHGAGTLIPCQRDLPGADRRGWSQLASAISSYRLIDVIAQVDGVGVKNAPPVPRQMHFANQRTLEVCVFVLQAADAEAIFPIKSFGLICATGRSWLKTLRHLNLTQHPLPWLSSRRLLPS